MQYHRVVAGPTYPTQAPHWYVERLKDDGVWVKDSPNFYRYSDAVDTARYMERSHSSPNVLTEQERAFVRRELRQRIDEYQDELSRNGVDSSRYAFAKPSKAVQNWTERTRMKVEVLKSAVAKLGFNVTA